MTPPGGLPGRPVTCRSCNALIVWVKTAATGSSMPVDAVPDQDRGNVIIEDRKAVVLGKGATPLGDPTRYTSHHMTCPQGKNWRRK